MGFGYSFSVVPTLVKFALQKNIDAVFAGSFNHFDKVISQINSKIASNIMSQNWGIPHFTTLLRKIRKVNNIDFAEYSAEKVPHFMQLQKLGLINFIKINFAEVLVKG